MSSTIALLLPATSVVYLLQTIFNKRKSKIVRFLFSLPALAMLIADLFVFLVFYVNCSEASMYYGNLDCIGGISLTADFVIMISLSLVVLLSALYGLSQKWGRVRYFIYGSIVIYLGLLVRLFLLVGAKKAIAVSSGSSNPVVFEIFAVVIVYGLVSSLIYLSVAFLGLFKPYTPRQSKE